MDNKELDNMMNEEEMQDDIVVITDEEGNETYYAEEMVIPLNGKNFAVLVAVEMEDCECGEDCHCHEHEEASEDDDNVIIARVDFDENGEPVYVGPTDEEFEAVSKKLVEMWDEE